MTLLELPFFAKIHEIPHFTLSLDLHNNFTYNLFTINHQIIQIHVIHENNITTKNQQHIQYTRSRQMRRRLIAHNTTRPIFILIYLFYFNLFYLIYIIPSVFLPCWRSCWRLAWVPDASSRRWPPCRAEFPLTRGTCCWGRRPRSSPQTCALGTQLPAAC